METHEHMLRELLEDVAAEHNYKDADIKIEAISSGGANYTSVLYNITVADSKTELKLFAKVANLSEKTRTVVPTFIFDTERYVYRDLAHIFKSIEQKCKIPEEERYVLPKFYGYNPNIYEETIILENLAAQGYVVYDRLKSIDWPYASKAVEIIAKFHALAMAYGEQNPEEYRKLLEKLNDDIEPAYKSMSDNFKSFVIKALSVTREENKERLRKFFEKECSLEGAIFSRYTKPTRKAAIIHGDFRPSNIMHRVNEDGTIDLIPLDYQTIQAGSGVADLLYFIFSGSDAEFRATHYQKLIDRYYHSLSTTLRRLRLNPDKIYSREDFDYELQQALPYGLIVAVFLLPVVTVESDDAPDINADDVWNTLSQAKTGRHYPARLNGIIDDYVRWGIL
ncbi:uncharacterized protein LOC128677916 [Plodia interpunctella]|uniref:uncharacterized protein LOC128677916 n=1 Tax=Plodia interpunctella TaxID=58824 RepID=UPI002368D400|nr:uncharacterized protein LOC128677916 [Plodia interpunctella]XP_053615058.1 uncharacterized protein LOC128677916 [Plodia interpunctella]